MHRHAYSGRKLSLDRDQRRALIRGQVTSLVLHENIHTTTAKAKEIVPHFEKLITKAKKGDLANQRALRSFLLTENAVQKMIQELVPAYADRQGGYARITKTANRRGDNAPMAMVSLVLPAKAAKAADETVESAAETKQPAAAAKAPAKTKTASAKPTKRTRTAKKAATKEKAK